MLNGPSARLPRRRGWFALVGCAVVYTLVVLVTVLLRVESTSDFRDFWNNALHFRQTGEIAADLGVHNYLPFFTIFMLPWTLVPLRVAAVLFVGLSLGLFAVAATLVENLLQGRSGPQPRPALLLALALALPYVHSCAVLGNVDLVVLFLVVATWFLVEHRHEVPAGIALGLATLIKVLPGVLLVFFLLKRRWKVAAATGVTMLVLGLGLPVVTVGWSQTVLLHQEYYQRAVTSGSAIATITSEKPAKALYSNNSIPIVLRRLLSRVNGARNEPGGLYVNCVELPRREILVIYVALVAVLVIASAALAVPGARPWPPPNVSAGHVVRGQFAVWCCLMLLTAPLVWTHYLPLLYWPLALLADQVERSWQGGRVERVGLGALAVWLMGALLLAVPAARAAGAQIASVVVVWLALGVLTRLQRI